MLPTHQAGRQCRMPRWKGPDGGAVRYWSFVAIGRRFDPEPDAKRGAGPWIGPVLTVRR